MNQVRPLRWHDLPLVYRLIGHGASFDAQFSLTVGDDGLRHSLLSNSGNTHSFVMRQGGGAFGLLRSLPDTQSAGLSYLAPGLDQGGREEQWLALIGGMSVIAGQRGIVAIRAEAGDDTPEFAVLREAEFGVYAHQSLWERPAGPAEGGTSLLEAASADEVSGLMGMIDARSPSLLRQITLPPGNEAECYVLGTRRASGMVAVYRGAGRVLADLYLSIEAHEKAPDMVTSLLAIAGAEANTVICRVRHDMEWIGRHLAEAGFDWSGSQAILVRHTMAHIRRHTVMELPAKRGMIPNASHIVRGEPPQRRPDPARPASHERTHQPV